MQKSHVNYTVGAEDRKLIHALDRVMFQRVHEVLRREIERAQTEAIRAAKGRKLRDAVLREVWAEFESKIGDRDCRNVWFKMLGAMKAAWKSIAGWAWKEERWSNDEYCQVQFAKLDLFNPLDGR